MSKDQKYAHYVKTHPFTSILTKVRPSQNGDLYVSEPDRALLKSILNRPDVKLLYADEMGIMFSRPMPNDKGDNFYQVYFLNTQPELTGKSIVEATTDVDPIER